MSVHKREGRERVEKEKGKTGEGREGQFGLRISVKGTRHKENNKCRVKKG